MKTVPKKTGRTPDIQHSQSTEWEGELLSVAPQHGKAGCPTLPPQAPSASAEIMAALYRFLPLTFTDSICSCR